MPHAWLALPAHGQLVLPERQPAVGASQVPSVPLVGGGGSLQALPGSFAPLPLVLLPQVHLSGPRHTSVPKYISSITVEKLAQIKRTPPHYHSSYQA